MTDENFASKGARVRLVALIAILIAIFLAMKLLPVGEWLRNFNNWVGRMGVAGIFVFIIVYLSPRSCLPRVQF